MSIILMKREKKTMILNVADLKKLIQDLNDDTIVQIYDGNDHYVISDAEVTHDEETDKYHMLYLWVRKLTNKEGEENESD